MILSPVELELGLVEELERTARALMDIGHDQALCLSLWLVRPGPVRPTRRRVMPVMSALVLARHDDRSAPDTEWQVWRGGSGTPPEARCEPNAEAWSGAEVANTTLPTVDRSPSANVWRQGPSSQALWLQLAIDTVAAMPDLHLEHLTATLSALAESLEAARSCVDNTAGRVAR